MSILALLHDTLRLPVIAAPMFIVSQPALVIAQCKAGIVGSFPALNARPKEALDQWLTEIKTALHQEKIANPEAKIAPFAVNQIVHPSNDRLEYDMEVCIQHQVPMIITSLHAPDKVVPHVHSYGGLVLHDVISVRHAEKALEAGVDGLILVCNGAGGHGGRLSPFALVNEIRRFYDGLIILSGAITHGSSILAAQALGADLAYIGTRFIATTEANVGDEYKAMLVSSHAEDIVYTNYFTGVYGNYLRGSIIRSGLDPDNLGEAEKSKLNFANAGNDRIKAWKDIWGAGQGVGAIDEIISVRACVDQLLDEYHAARNRI